MDYRSAFEKVINQHGLEILNNDFLVRSFLYDYVSNSYSEYRKIEAFYTLTKSNSIVQNIQKSDLSACKEFFKNLINKSSKEYSRLEYVRSVEPLLLHLFPNKYVQVKEQTFLDKHQSIKIIKTEVAKPILKPIKKTRKKLETFDDILLHIKCNKFVISYSKARKAKLFVGKNNNAIKNASMSINKKTLNLKIDDKNSYYRLELPEKCYESIGVRFNGNILIIEGDCSKRFKTKEMTILCDKGDLSINMNATNMKIRQKSGNIALKSKNKTLTINANKSNIQCTLDSNEQKQCNILTASGNVNLVFPSVSIKPKINHLFRKTRKVSGVYFLKSKPISMDIRTFKGKIICK